MIRGYYGVHLGIEVAGTEKVEIRTLKVGRYCAVDDSAFKILKISKSKPGKHGSAKARLDLEDLFTGSKRSHVGTVTDKISIPIIEKGSATVTHIQGVDVHAMDAKTFEMMILPLEDGLNLESGREIQWMEALGRFRIIRDH
jgi:translation initiation factor 5A